MSSSADDFKKITFDPEAKQAQMVEVQEYVLEKGLIPKETVAQEVSWFYTNLGIDDLYFREESVSVIAGHIMSLYGAKVLSYTSGKLDINLEDETENGAVFIHNSRPGVSRSTGPQYEDHIDETYFDNPKDGKLFRLETYRSSGTVASNSSAQLRCYFISKCEFANPEPKTTEEKQDIKQVSDKKFLERASENTLQIYQRIMIEALKRNGPVIEMFDFPTGNEKRLVIGYRRGGTRKYFAALSDLYHYYSLFSPRKYVEQFSNGVTIISIYLMPTAQWPMQDVTIESAVNQVLKEASLLYTLPDTPFRDLFKQNALSVQETSYAYVAWIFCQHFLNRLGSDYGVLVRLMDPNDASHIAVLDRIKKRLREETYTREFILATLQQYPELVKLCYANFALEHYIQTKSGGLRPTLSIQRVNQSPAKTEEDIMAVIKKTITNNRQFEIFQSCLTFNKHVLKTNFYQPTKVALSFRFDPSFLRESEYPVKPYGIFMVVGSEFRGFHIRFADVSRGGVRIVKSFNKEVWATNYKTLFDENYNLSYTQQRKNKDIPEGGAKGTILLNWDAQDKGQVAFEKYIDGLIDLIIPGESPGIKDKIVDKYDKEEMLFLGPDENTADKMNWACLHAKHRGLKFWKAFTTGKSTSLGGIPHDVYGMTTRSIHSYTTGVYEKLGLKEEEVTKFQTGGPDGDLGSNEIKISSDKTVAIVDGSGVIVDPQGLDRQELLRLAKARIMIEQFDLSKLSPEGYRVLVSEKSVTLPNGTVIDNCMAYRNNFHLLPESSATIFVPCGGRPEAINTQNVEKLFGADGLCRFKYIVEGANLFITQSARLHLEKKGVILFKDSSTNKGGVTSSSLEVLAALSLDDEGFAKHMQVGSDGTVPDFYQRYVKDVQAKIVENARLEFECLWNARETMNQPTSILSDQLSHSINSMADEMSSQPQFWEDVALRKIVFQQALPQSLLELVGLDTLMERIPENYLKAIFHCWLASRFIYTHGVQPSQFAFFVFMSKLKEKTQTAASN